MIAEPPRAACVARSEPIPIENIRPSRNAPMHGETVRPSCRVASGASTLTGPLTQPYRMEYNGVRQPETERRPRGPELLGLLLGVAPNALTAKRPGHGLGGRLKCGSRPGCLISAGRVSEGQPTNATSTPNVAYRSHRPAIATKTMSRCDVLSPVLIRRIGSFVRRRPRTRLVPPMLVELHHGGGSRACASPCF